MIGTDILRQRRNDTMLDNKKQSAVFIDIDGTLMGHSAEALAENLGVIQKLRSLGHKFFICTGRANSYIPKILDTEKNFDGMITGAGAYVSIGRKVISKKLMSYDTVEKVCRFFADNKVRGVLEGEKNMYFFEETCFNEEDWIKLDSDNTPKLINKDTPILKFTVDGMFPEGFEDLLGTDYTFLQHPDYGEVIRKGYSKSEGVRTALEALGIPKTQSVAIGDSLNDLDMLEYAQIGVAMGNGTDEIKHRADFVTDSADNAGVAKALRKIFDLNE